MSLDWGRTKPDKLRRERTRAMRAIRHHARGDVQQALGSGARSLDPPIVERHQPLSRRLRGQVSRGTPSPLDVSDTWRFVRLSGDADGERWRRQGRGWSSTVARRGAVPAASVSYRKQSPPRRPQRLSPLLRLPVRRALRLGSGGLSSSGRLTATASAATATAAAALPREADAAWAAPSAAAWPSRGSRVLSSAASGRPLARAP
jgi:hypothetical protein